MTYFKKTISGFFWTSALSGSIRVLAFAKIALLARILLPSQFGEFAVVSMVLAFLEIITETGINVFLIQEKDSLSKFVSTAWVVSIFRGIIISGLVILSAAPIAAFFHMGAARNLLLVAGLIPFLRGFINPACIKFQKELNFSTDFWYRLSIVVVEIGLTAILALTYKSASSLVLGLVGAAVFETIISWVFITPRPKARMDYGQIKVVLSRGKWVTGYGLFDYVFTTIDNVVVGRLLGSSALGIYQNAYKLALLPGNQINDIYYKTTTPIYVKMLENDRKLAKSVLVGTGGLLLLQSLVSVAMYFLAQPLVLLTLGPNWVAAVPVVKILAFLSLIRGVIFSFNSVFVAKQHQKYVAIVTFVSMLGIVALIVPQVLSRGIVGAAYAAVIGAAIAVPVMFYFALRLIRGL